MPYVPARGRAVALILLWLSAAVVARVLRAAPAPPPRVAEAQQCIDVTKPVTIGDASGIEFGGIAGGVFVNDSVLAVADRMSLNVRFFSLSGSLLATHGRAGSGPGEFRNIQRISARADTVVAFDARQRKLIFLTSRDGYARAEDSEPGMVQILSDGRKVYARNPVGTSRGRSGPEIWTDSLVIRVVDDAGNGRSLATVEDETRIIDLTMGLYQIPAPYSGSPALAAGRDYIVVGNGSPRIRRFRYGGQEINALASPFVAEAVTRDAVQKWIEHRLSRTLPQHVSAIRGLFAIAQPPRTAPAHGRIRIDRRNRVWIQEYRAPHDERPSRLAIVDEAGRTVGAAVLPSGHVLLAVSASALAVLVTDSDGVESIKLYRSTC